MKKIIVFSNDYIESVEKDDFSPTDIHVHTNDASITVLELNESNDKPIRRLHTKVDTELTSKAWEYINLEESEGEDVSAETVKTE